MKVVEYVIWSGKLSVKGLYGCCVQIISPELLIIPVKLGTSINISCKVGIKEGREKFLHEVTTLTRGKETFSDGWYINACQMTVSQSKSNFEKIRHYLTDKECMALLKLEEDILLVMTDNEVTCQLGLTKHSHESSIHCIFLSKTSRKQKGSAQFPRHEEQIVYQTKKVDEKGDYDHIRQTTAQQTRREVFMENSSTKYKQQRKELEQSRTECQQPRAEFTPPKTELGQSGVELVRADLRQLRTVFEHETQSTEHLTTGNRQMSQNPSAVLPPEQRFFDDDNGDDRIVSQTPVVLESDSSLKSVLGRIFGDMEIVESSRSPFPENYTELIVDQRSQNIPWVDPDRVDPGGVDINGGAPSGEGSFHPSPEYSNKLAEALSLSCQEAGQKTSENDDLPPLIPWLPVNISKTAVTPKSPKAESKPLATHVYDSNQSNVSDNNNNLGTFGRNNYNCGNIEHDNNNPGNIEHNLKQPLEHQIEAYRTVTPPPPFLQQETMFGIEILNSNQKPLSRPPSLETVYSKYSPGSSLGNSSLGASFKADSFCTPYSGNSFSAPLMGNSLGISFSGNISDASSPNFGPSNSNIQPAPLDVSFIKQEPEDDHCYTSVTMATPLSHPAETVIPTALDDINSHWPRHFMDAFLEPKLNRNPSYVRCTQNTRGEDSPMFTPEHMPDNEENIGSQRIPGLEKSPCKPGFETVLAGKKPIYGPIARQTANIDTLAEQAEHIGRLAETACQLMESDINLPSQMDFDDDPVDVKAEPEDVVSRLYSEYQDELKGLQEKPSPHLYRCSSVSDLTRNGGLKKNSYGNHPNLHLLLDNGFWPKPPKTSFLQLSRVRESFIEQAKKKKKTGTRSLKRSNSFLELKELIEKYGTRKLEVPKMLAAKAGKPADIAHKDKKSSLKPSKKKDRNRAVAHHISDLERREEHVDIGISSKTDTPRKVGHEITSILKMPDKMSPKVVLEKLNLSGKKSCKVGETEVESTEAEGKHIKLKIILSPDSRVTDMEAERNQSADVENSSAEEIDSDTPLDTVVKMKMLNSFRKQKKKKKKVADKGKLIEEKAQNNIIVISLDEKETRKSNSSTEIKERNRKHSEFDAKHSSHHHKKHKHDKRKDKKSKHSQKSKDDKPGATGKDKHWDKPKDDTLESANKIVIIEANDKTSENDKQVSDKSKDSCLTDHIQIDEVKNKTSDSSQKLSPEKAHNDPLETDKNKETDKSKEPILGKDHKETISLSKVKEIEDTDKRKGLENSHKTPKKGTEHNIQDKKKEQKKETRKENDVKAKDKYITSFSKALDDIVSAKVEEVMAGSKKRKAEDHKSDADTSERKHKTGSPKRKCSKTEAEKMPGKEKKTKIKSSSLSRKQEAAVKVLSALNMGVSRVEVSSLGRIPKKHSVSSSKKIKKEEETEDEEDRTKKRKTGKKENAGKNLKDGHCTIPGDSDHKKDGNGEAHHHKDRSKHTESNAEKDNRKRHFSANSATERGAIAANDEMILGSDFDDFVDNQKPLYKIGHDSNENLKEQGNTLFTSVMETRPETGTIPGLGGLEYGKMSPTVEKWKDPSKRQVIKAGSGLKCVLLDYDPVDVDDGMSKVEITECLNAVLHGVRSGQAPKKDFVSDSIHKGVHGTTDWVERKTVSKSVNTKGATTVLVILNVKPDHVHSTETEAVKEKTEEAGKSEASPEKLSRLDSGDGRKTVDSTDKKKKPDLVLQVPEKMVVILDESHHEMDTSECSFDENNIDNRDGIAFDDFREREETNESSQTLNMSFGKSLKQNLPSVLEIKAEKLDEALDKLSENYAGEESKAGPEKTTTDKTSPVKSTTATAGGGAKTGLIKSSLAGGDSKAAPTKPPDSAETTSTLVVDVIVKDKQKGDPSSTVNVTVEFDEDLAAKQKDEKGKTEERRHSSGNKELNNDKNSEPRDPRRRSRSKSGEWLVLSSEGLSFDISESAEDRDKSSSRRRSRSKSTSKDEIEPPKSSWSRSRNNSESKSSRKSREKSMPKESSSGKSSRASSEVRDDKSSKSKRRHSSGSKSKGGSKEEPSNKEEKKSVAERLETLASKTVPATETSKTESRHSRQYHPYKKEEKKDKKSRKPKWSFDLAYRDMNELLQNLTSSFFRQANRAPVPIPRTTKSAKSYDRKPRRFAGYRFERSEIPKTPPRTRSPSPFDPEADELGPEMIPDLAEREEKADEIEDLFMQTIVASEDEEYNREQDIYSEEEDDDGCEKHIAEAGKDKPKSDNDRNDDGALGSKNEKTDNNSSKLINSRTDNLKSMEERTSDTFPNSKGDMPDTGSMKSLSVLVIPGAGKTSLFSRIELDEENVESLELLGGPSFRPLATEVTATVPDLPDVSKASHVKGVSLNKQVKSEGKMMSISSVERIRDRNQPFKTKELGLPLHDFGHKNLFPDTKQFEDGGILIETLSLEKEAGIQNQMTVREPSSDNVSVQYKTVVKKVKDRTLLLSVDSDSCLDWTDDEVAADKVVESTAFASSDDLSDVAEGKKYLVVDSVGGSDSESCDDVKQKTDSAKQKGITNEDCIEKNEGKEHDARSNTLNDDVRKRNDQIEKNVLSDVTEASALKMSPTLLHKDRINHQAHISSVDKSMAETNDRTGFIHSEAASSVNGNNGDLITSNTNTFLNEEEKIRNSEISPLSDKGDYNVSEIERSVVVGEENDLTNISRSLDLSRSPVLVIDESGSNVKSSPSVSEDDAGSKPKPCSDISRNAIEDNLRSCENLAEEVIKFHVGKASDDVRANLKAQYETENDTKLQTNSEAINETERRVKSSSTIVERSEKCVHLELDKLNNKENEKLGLVDVSSFHPKDDKNTNELQSDSVEREAGSVLIIDEIDTEQEEVLNCSSTAEDEDVGESIESYESQQKHDTSLVYLDDMVSSCDEDPSNILAACSNIASKEGPAVVYLDDTVTSADETVREANDNDFTDEPDIIFVKKTKLEESYQDDVIYIPEAAAEVEIVDFQNTTDNDNSISYWNKEDKPDTQVYGSAMQPIDLSSHRNELSNVGNNDIYTMVQEGVNTDDIVIAIYDKESNDMKAVVGVVNSGLDSPVSEEKIEHHSIGKGFGEAELPQIDETLATTSCSISGKPCLTDTINVKHYQTRVSQPVTTGITAYTRHSFPRYPLPLDTMNIYTTAVGADQICYSRTERPSEFISAYPSVPSYPSLPMPLQYVNSNYKPKQTTVLPQTICSPTAASGKTGSAGHIGKRKKPDSCDFQTNLSISTYPSVGMPTENISSCLLDSSNSDVDIVLGSSSFDSDFNGETDILKQASKNIKKRLMKSKRRCLEDQPASERKENTENTGRVFDGSILSDEDFNEPQALVQQGRSLSVPTANIAVTTSQRMETASAATAADRYPSRSVAAIAPLPSVSSPSDVKSESDNHWEWISPPSQPALHTIVSLTSAAVNHSHSTSPFSQSVLGSCLVPVTSVGQEISPYHRHGLLSNPYFVSPFPSHGSGIGLLGPGPFPSSGSQTLIAPFSSSYQTVAWPHTSPAPGNYGTRGVVSLGSTIYDSAYWQNYHSQYQGLNPQVYQSTANIQQNQQQPCSTAQLQPWMFSVRFSPDFRPTNPHTFFSIIQSRNNTFTKSFYPSLPSLKDSTNFKSENDTFGSPLGKNCSIPNLKELCAKTIESNSILNSAAAQTFARELVGEAQKPVGENIDISMTSDSELQTDSISSETLTKNCLNPYRDRAEVQGDGKGLDFSSTVPCKGLTENDQLPGTIDTKCDPKSVEIPEYCKPDDLKHSLVPENASKSYQNIEESLDAVKQKSNSVVSANNSTNTSETPQNFSVPDQGQFLTSEMTVARNLLNSVDLEDCQKDISMYIPVCSGISVPPKVRYIMYDENCLGDGESLKEIAEDTKYSEDLTEGSDILCKDGGDFGHKQPPYVSWGRDDMEKATVIDADGTRSCLNTKDGIGSDSSWRKTEAELLRPEQGNTTNIILSETASGTDALCAQSSENDNERIIQEAKSHHSSVQLEDSDNEMKEFYKEMQPLLLDIDIRECQLAVDARKRELENEQLERDTSQNNVTQMMNPIESERDENNTSRTVNGLFSAGIHTQCMNKIYVDLQPSQETSTCTEANTKISTENSNETSDRSELFLGNTQSCASYVRTDRENKTEADEFESGQNLVANDMKFSGETERSADAVNHPKKVSDIEVSQERDDIEAGNSCKEKNSFREEMDEFYKSFDPLLIKADIRDCVRALQLKHQEIEDSGISSATEDASLSSAVEFLDWNPSQEGSMEEQSDHRKKIAEQETGGGLLLASLHPETESTSDNESRSKEENSKTETHDNLAKDISNKAQDSTKSMELLGVALSSETGTELLGSRQSHATDVASLKELNSTNPINQSSEHELRDPKTISMTDCYIWNGEIIPLNKTIGPQKAEKVGQFELVEISCLNDKQGTESSNITMGQSVKNESQTATIGETSRLRQTYSQSETEMMGSHASNSSAASLGKLSKSETLLATACTAPAKSFERGLIQVENAASICKLSVSETLLASDSFAPTKGLEESIQMENEVSELTHMNSDKETKSKLKCTDMEMTENASKEEEKVQTSRGKENACFGEIDQFYKTLDPLLLRDDIKDCLKALEIKRKEIAAKNNAVEVLELKATPEISSVEQTDQTVSKVTLNHTGIEKREKTVDNSIAGSNNKLNHSQMSLSSFLKTGRTDHVARRSLVDYEEENDHYPHSSDAVSTYNIVAYEDNDTDDEDHDKDDEIGANKETCVNTSAPFTNEKQDELKNELDEQIGYEKQVQEEVGETVTEGTSDAKRDRHEQSNQADNGNNSTNSGLISLSQVSKVTSSLQPEKDSDTQSHMEDGKKQLEPISGTEDTREPEIDNNMQGVSENISKPTSEVTKCSDRTDSLTQFSDLDSQFHQESSSAVFTDEEIKFSASSSVIVKMNKPETNSKQAAQKTLSMSLLSSAYDEETSNESDEASALTKRVEADFMDSLAALKGYTDDDSDSSESESDASSGDSSSDSSSDESELTDNQDSSAKAVTSTPLNDDCQMSSSDELRDKLLEKGFKASNSQTDEEKAAETKERSIAEMDKYLKCKWAEEGILSPDNSETESVCNTSCGSPDTIKVISDTEELYQSDAIVHQKPFPQNSGDDFLDRSAYDRQRRLMSTKRYWHNSTGPNRSSVARSVHSNCSDTSEKPNILEASFAESSASNISDLSLAKLEERQKRLINKILMENDSDSSVKTGSESGSETSNAKVKAAVTKKLADIRSWIQKGEDEKQKNRNELKLKKTEESKSMSKKGTQFVRRKMLTEKFEEGWDSSCSDNDVNENSKHETSKEYSIITVDSVSGSYKDIKSACELSDSKSAGELSDFKSAGELSDSTTSVKSVSTVRSLGQRSEADLRAVVITIRNDRAESASATKSLQRTSSPLSPLARKGSQSGSRQNDSLEYVSNNLDAKMNNNIKKPSQNRTNVHNQSSYKPRDDLTKSLDSRETGWDSGLYDRQKSYNRPEQWKTCTDGHRSRSGSFSPADDYEINNNKTWNRNEQKSGNIRLSSRRDNPKSRTRASSREQLRPDLRGSRKRSCSFTRSRRGSRSVSRERHRRISRSHSRGKSKSVSPRMMLRSSRSPGIRDSRSRSRSFRSRTGSRSYGTKRRSRSRDFQRRTRSPASKSPDSRISRSRSRSYNSEERSGSGMFRKRLSSPGLKSRSGSRDSRKSEYTQYERYNRSKSRESGALSSSSSDRGFDERFTSKRDHDNRSGERDRFHSERFSSRNDSEIRSGERNRFHSGQLQSNLKDADDARKKNLEYISRWNNNDRKQSRDYDRSASGKRPTSVTRVETRGLIDEMKGKTRGELSRSRTEVARLEAKALIDEMKNREMRDPVGKVSTQSVGAHTKFDLRCKLGRKQSFPEHTRLLRSDSKPNGAGNHDETRSGQLTSRTSSKDRPPRDIRPVVRKEKIVILHSSVLAYEKLDDLCELIESLAQYSTSTCHWKALLHSRMICDLDEWRSVNLDCSFLLQLLSRLRADDHVELLPFHGCDEDKMTNVQCAEQILRERDNVQTAFLISGKSFTIQIRSPPAGPTVCTEDPVDQLDILISTGKKVGTGKGLMYVCIAEHKGTKEKPFTEFTYSVVVDGVTYKGTGRSKNEAKSAAAKAALIGRFKILSVPSY